MKKYTPNEWMELEGLFAEDMERYYPGVVAFYADDESPIAGCKYEDGTFGAFGCAEDVNGLTCEQMLDLIIKGRDE